MSTGVKIFTVCLPGCLKGICLFAIAILPFLPSRSPASPVAGFKEPCSCFIVEEIPWAYGKPLFLRIELQQRARCTDQKRFYFAFVVLILDNVKGKVF